MFVRKFEERHRTKHDAKLINIIATYFHRQWQTVRTIKNICISITLNLGR